MDIEELLRLMKLFEEAGWQPLICDTQIPVVENPVRAGIPAEPGNMRTEMVSIPKALLSMLEEMMIRVKGDSMVDADVSDGDYVKLQLEKTPRSGDIVVAVIGNEVTLKVYYEDENGVRWLVAQNSEKRDVYKPIMLDGRGDEVIISGVVSEVLRQLPRISNRDIARELRAAKEAMEVNMDIPQQRISSTIKTLAKKIKVGRTWYSVYRKMVDLLIYPENDYESFCDRVRMEVPKHEHLPAPEELQRMAVGSFAKPVVKWTEFNAPVKGKRYLIYKNLADETEAMLLRGEGFE